MSGLARAAHLLYRTGSILTKASVWATLDPRRISQYYINRFLFRKVFSKFTFKWPI